MTNIEQQLTPLPTPCLLLDEAKMTVHINKLADHAAQPGVSLRPHLKTNKSGDVAHRFLPKGVGPAIVSTLAKAEMFAEGGAHDMLYGVGIAPQELSIPSRKQRPAAAASRTAALPSRR